jgi:hypothetical protein
MQIIELERLSNWFLEESREITKLYQQLLDPVQHNAVQNSKVAVEAPLDVLLEFLRNQKFDHLSLEQINVLSKLGVIQYIGQDGYLFIEHTIRTSEYDPVTAAAKLDKGIAAINFASKGFAMYVASLEALRMREGEADAFTKDRVIVRVGFRQEASINHLTDLKDSSKDWYDIIRGLSLAANEAPEDTKIVGAATGSIILILAGTTAVTGLLALISKHIINAATQVVGLQNQIEDLRHKKWLNRTIENELKKQIDSTKTNTTASILTEIKEIIRDLDGEQINALEVAIKKLLTFSEKGGNVDFVSPASDENNFDELLPDFDTDKDPLLEVGGLIREYQTARENLKLLTQRKSD